MRKIKRLVPLFIVIIMNICGFGSLHLLSPVDENLLTLSIGLILFLIITYIAILFFTNSDDYLFLVVSMLLTLGILMLTRLGQETAIKQITWLYLGIGCFWFVFIIYRSFNFWKMLAVPYLVMSVLLFVMTLALGSRLGGAKNWIMIAGFSIQPAEIIKVPFILLLACLYQLPYDTGGNTRLEKILSSVNSRQFLIMGIVYMYLGFLVLQREWGLSLLYFAVYFAMQFVFGKNIGILFLNMLTAGTGAAMGVMLMPHIQTRFIVWQNPFSNASDIGYQIVQSLYAIASGGFLGSGFTAGQPEIIPVVKSDFIFSAICEEFGTLCGIGVVFLFFILVYRGLKLSIRVANGFNKAVSLGFSVMFAAQAFIIIAGVIKLIPLTGITLPFMSQGGSSMVTSFAALGILQAISAKTEDLIDDY